MIDQQSVERAAERFRLPEESFERLLSRRERKQRNRQIRAGAVGVVVALAIGIALVRSLTSDSIPADPPVEPKPAPAPAGTLAYNLDGDVYVAEPDGSNAVKIADGISEDDCASTDGFSFWAEGSMWSPDGRYLAYRRTDCSSEAPGTTDENWGDVVISDAVGNVHATFPADGWDIGWSPDSSLVAVWDTLFEKVGVYGVDGARQARITMPAGWRPDGDHDPAWLRDGTLAVEDVELPLDGGAAAYSLDTAQVAEWQEDYLVTIGVRADSPDGFYTASFDRRSLIVEGSDGSRLVTPLSVERGTSFRVIEFSPEGDSVLFSSGEGGAAGVVRTKLWIVGVDGSDPRVIVAGTLDGDWFVPLVASEDTTVDPPIEP